MLDQLRQQIQTRLNELLAEADKLRRALGALGSRDGAATPSPAPERARRRARSAPASRAATRKPARPRSSAATAAASPSPQPAEPPASAPAARRARTAARAASGSTKTAVLEALTGGNAMTAGEVATATGLGRASVGSTLSKLAKTGEVTKAARGYQLAGQTAGASADAAASAESDQSAG
jgi:hypothetical protein